MKPLKKLLILTLSGFLLLCSNSLFAQWKSKLSLSSFMYTGNSNKFDFRSQAGVSHRDSLFEYSTSLKAVYSETNNKPNKEEYSGVLKFDYLPYGEWSPFIAISAYSNQYKAIQLRLSAFAGGKWTFYEINKSDYSISAAFQYDHESYTEITQEENDSTYIPDPESKYRISVRPKFEQQIGENIFFKQVTFYQPNLKDFDEDYLIDSSTSLSSKINDIIKMKISYEVEFDSTAEERGKKNTDTAFLVSIVFEF